MERPQSIVMFERAYLGGWAIGLINTLLNWAVVSADPNVAEANAMVGSWYLPTMTAIGLIIPLLLWYFIARRGSVVAKWIMVVLTAFGVVGILFSLMTGRFPVGIPAVLSAIGVALNIYAASRLFRPDTRPWFGEDATEPL